MPRCCVRGISLISSYFDRLIGLGVTNCNLILQTRLMERKAVLGSVFEGTGGGVGVPQGSIAGGPS